MAHANPGLRPGLSSAVPTGLSFVMVVLTQTLKPRSLLGLDGPTKSRALIQIFRAVAPEPRACSRFYSPSLNVGSQTQDCCAHPLASLRDSTFLPTGPKTKTSPDPRKSAHCGVSRARNNSYRLRRSRHIGGRIWCGATGHTATRALC